MLKFRLHKGETNYHGTQAKGERWNQQTVRGSKFVWYHLENLTGKIPGRRIIYYFRDGSCWYFDAYLKPKATK